MQLRFIEDRKTLFWAFVLFPGVPALAYARPSLIGWLVPFSLYLAYCAGVLTHNHNHCPVFASKRANVAYGAWLSIFYGCPTFTWIPTHNQNHHRYLNGEGDATRTSKLSPRNSLAVALIYPLASSRWQLPGIRRYAASAFHAHPPRFRRILAESVALVFGHAALLGLAIALHGASRGVLVYAVSVGLPALSATYWMMLTNYVQHVDCDPSSADNHSRNFVSPFFNWFVFDNGLHTVHHEHPGVHWSRYRALHEARAARIEPGLNPRSIFGYVARQYLLRPYGLGGGGAGGAPLGGTAAGASAAGGGAAVAGPSAADSGGIPWTAAPVVSATGAATDDTQSKYLSRAWLSGGPCMNMNEQPLIHGKPTRAQGARTMSRYRGAPRTAIASPRRRTERFADADRSPRATLLENARNAARPLWTASRWGRLARKRQKSGDPEAEETRGFEPSGVTGKERC